MIIVIVYFDFIRGAAMPGLGLCRLAIAWNGSLGGGGELGCGLR